jgi:AraC-like DNA-binding protein
VALLGVLQKDSLSLARLTSAIGSEHELVPCSDWGALWEAVAGLPLDGCVVDVYRPSRAVGFREIQRLRKRRPTLAIMVYDDFAGREMDLFELGRLKVDAVLLAGGNESPRGIQAAVAEALVSSLAARVTAALAGRVPAPGPDLLRWAIENAHRRPLVGDLAEAFSWTRRSLARVLESASLPAATRLLLWGRLFRAAQLLDDRGATVEQVAYSLGYATGAALSRALRRCTGYAPRELQRRGVLACALDAFVRDETHDAPRSPVRSWSRVGGRLTSSPGRRGPR